MTGEASAMDAQQRHYENKLAYEIDSWELIGGLDWWKRDGHPTSPGEAADAADECGCN